MTKGIAESIKVKLLNIAKSKNANYQQLLIRYLYERLLYRLSVSQYKEKFCLKGGALLYAFEKDLPRPTLDIDFLGLKIYNGIETIKNVFTEVLAITRYDGIELNTSNIKAEEINENNSYHGVKVTFEAKLDSIRQIMHMDIGFGDVIIPTAQELSYPVLLDELPAPQIMAYSLESVVSEKFQAMIELSEVNSRYKDFYDVYKILTSQNLNVEVLEKAVMTTFENRNTPFQENHPLFSDSFAKDESRNTQWKRFLKKIKQDEELKFEDVMKLIRMKLLPIFEKLNLDKN